MCACDSVQKVSLKNGAVGETETSELPGCQHCTVPAIVYTVEAKITLTINEEESTISVFQSFLVSLLLC